MSLVNAPGRNRETKAKPLAIGFSFTGKNETIKTGVKITTPAPVPELWHSELLEELALFAGKNRTHSFTVNAKSAVAEVLEKGRPIVRIISDYSFDSKRGYRLKVRTIEANDASHISRFAWTLAGIRVNFGK